MATNAADGRTGRARQIVETARKLLEEAGAEGLTMRGLADRLGIRAPSLYKHVADKQALEAAIISDGFVELAEAFDQATTGSDDPLEGIAAAYRAFARAHPHLYRLMTERPLDREALPDGVEDRAALPLQHALRGDTDLTRAAWAFAHGMTNLELNGRFPEDADLDAAWERGLEAFRGSTSAIVSA